MPNRIVKGSHLTDSDIGKFVLVHQWNGQSREGYVEKENYTFPNYRPTHKNGMPWGMPNLTYYFIYIYEGKYSPKSKHRIYYSYRVEFLE